jgi:hypothetical protein
MNKNPSLNNNQTLEDSIKKGFHYPKPINTASTDKWVEYIKKFMRKEPVMVIDLDTLQLRPSRYQ